MPQRGVAWPDAGDPRIGDVHADRLWALLGWLAGTGKQTERLERIRKMADELSRSAGSRRTQRYR